MAKSSTRLTGADVVTALKRAFRAKTDQQLTAFLGNTAHALVDWKRRPSVSARQVAGIVRSAHRAGAKALQTRAVRPLVEFFRIDRCKSQRSKTFALFSIGN